MSEWAVGDWVVFDLKIGQIKEIRDAGMVEFSDGVFSTSGRLADRFRPLTLRNKAITETFDIYYNRLHEIDGEAGFNYPHISSHFASLALMAIDGGEDEALAAHDRAVAFVRSARDHQSVIDGVPLFRPSLRRRS